MHTHPDILDYQQTLKSAFDRHYITGTDVWSADQEMRCFPPLIQGALKLGPDAVTLDIGCGTGADTSYFSSIYQLAIGIDIVEHANWKRILQKFPNVQFIATTFQDFHPNLRFDLILDNGCFHHQHPEVRVAFLDKTKSLLRPGGHFALSTFKCDTIDEFWDDHGRLHKYFKDRELHDLLTSAGFAIVEEMNIFRRRTNNYYRFTLCKAYA